MQMLVSRRNLGFIKVLCAFAAGCHSCRRGENLPVNRPTAERRVACRGSSPAARLRRRAERSPPLRCQSETPWANARLGCCQIGRRERSTWCTLLMYIHEGIYILSVCQGWGHKHSAPQVRRQISLVTSVVFLVAAHAGARPARRRSRRSIRSL